MNKLTRLNTIDGIHSILKKNHEEANSIIMWRMVGDKKFTADVRIRIFNKTKKYLIICGINKRSTSMMLDLVSGSEKINFYLPDSMVLFQSKVESVNEENEIKICTPEFVALLDRREKLRLDLNQIGILKVNFSKKLTKHNQIHHHFSKPLKDISAGGMSFYISKMEGNFFKCNEKIDKIILKIDKKDIHVSGTIVSVENVDPNDHNRLNYKAIKIGVKFNDISHDHQKIIDEYVFKYIDLSLNVV